MLVQKYGGELAADLISLGFLYKRFECDGGYPWLVCNAVLEEARHAQGPKGQRLRQLIGFFAGHQEDWASDAAPGIAPRIAV